MKGQLKVSTPAEYIAKLEEPRRSEIAALRKPIRKLAPALGPFIHSGMLAYGRWHYRYASGREGDWFRIGVALLRFKRLSDLDQAALAKLIREGAAAVTI